MPVSSARTWYTAMVSAQEYFMEFTSAQNVLSSLFALFNVPVYANACMYECMRHNMQCLMQSEYVVASHGWESERMSMSERI